MVSNVGVLSWCSRGSGERSGRPRLRVTHCWLPRGATSCHFPSVLISLKVLFEYLQWRPSSALLRRAGSGRSRMPRGSRRARSSSCCGFRSTDMKALTTARRLGLRLGHTQPQAQAQHPAVAAGNIAAAASAGAADGSSATSRATPPPCPTLCCAIDRGPGPRPPFQIADEFFVGTHSTHRDNDDFVPETGKISDAHIRSDDCLALLADDLREID